MFSSNDIRIQMEVLRPRLQGIISIAKRLLNAVPVVKLPIFDRCLSFAFRNSRLCNVQFGVIRFIFELKQNGRKMSGWPLVAAPALCYFRKWNQFLKFSIYISIK